MAIENIDSCPGDRSSDWDRVIEFLSGRHRMGTSERSALSRPVTVGQGMTLRHGREIRPRVFDRDHVSASQELPHLK